MNVKSFNGQTVRWGDHANNMGFVKVPAGINTIIFDWVNETQITKLDSVNYSAVTGATTYTYVTTTTRSRLNNLTFTDAQMLPGHKYFIGGGKGVDGELRIWLLDMTYTPSGFYGDDVSNPPRASRTPTQFEGKWKNSHGETFEFKGNKFTQTIPPMTATNTGNIKLELQGTFEINDGYITLYVIKTAANGGIWVSIKFMKQSYIYKYSLDGNNLMLELPWMLPETAYSKQ